MINALLHVILISGGEGAMVLDLLAKRVRNVLRYPANNYITKSTCEWENTFAPMLGPRLSIATVSHLLTSLYILSRALTLNSSASARQNL